MAHFEKNLSPVRGEVRTMKGDPKNRLPFDTSGRTEPLEYYRRWLLGLGDQGRATVNVWHQATTAADHVGTSGRQAAGTPSTASLRRDTHAG